MRRENADGKRVERGKLTSQNRAERDQDLLHASSASSLHQLNGDFAITNFAQLGYRVAGRATIKRRESRNNGTAWTDRHRRLLGDESLQSRRPLPVTKRNLSLRQRSATFATPRVYIRARTHCHGPITMVDDHAMTTRVSLSTARSTDLSLSNFPSDSRKERTLAASRTSRWNRKTIVYITYIQIFNL